ncbi:PadR family transcriptional regulator [Brenneria izadpanahii]|uniref:PadR family transcriptional regulator n=1 Tax=Brenneria izadpanahii TaxID=2722756 RepID=A0ABX7UTC4_9GAMM|nr:PadR family transcriptional regulator [Brenneria izadpanahii]QTF07832.1 PadR family transcriptional regulator [Brenneria izadpanahii]
MKLQQSSPLRQSDDERRSACVKLRRKRRDKMLDANDIRLLILHFLSQGAAHGYELIKSIEDLSKGEYTPSPGIIYPSLTLLEEMACIRALDDSATRKAYSLEAKGRTLLQQNQDSLTVIIGRLTSLAILVNNRSIPEVERAIHNMKTALNSRLSKQDLSQQTLHTIIDAMDEAAKKIERS